MSILLAEDEPKTARILRKGLAEKGYTVDWVGDGEAALEAGLHGGHDLIILDIMLPGRDGWSVLVELRKAGKVTPVLCLTARDEVEDRVRGLDLGADDYLVKPFAFSELLARVRALARRGSGPPGEVRYQVADLMVDPVHHKAERAGRPLTLSPKEFDLLAFLAAHAGEVHSRAAIAREVWGMRAESDTNVIDVAIRRLRTKADIPFVPHLIHTVRG
ncbi:MAG: response regulator, partial [Gammaproteobacteria bacterium]